MIGFCKIITIPIYCLPANGHLIILGLKIIGIALLVQPASMEDPLFAGIIRLFAVMDKPGGLQLALFIEVVILFPDFLPPDQHFSVFGREIVFFLADALPAGLPITSLVDAHALYRHTCVLQVPFQSETQY